MRPAEEGAFPPAARWEKVPRQDTSIGSFASSKMAVNHTQHQSDVNLRA